LDALISLPCLFPFTVEIVFLIASGRGNTQPERFDIPHRWLAEESPVLPIELACTLVANLEGSACGIHTVSQHALPRYMQSKLLLKL
jgi:hypothetical protein